jgi:hypothetical protein
MITTKRVQGGYLLFKDRPVSSKQDYGKAVRFLLHLQLLKQMF